MSRRKKAETMKSGAPEWMVTYGDMVTLLLTFFVMLFSFSTIDAQKWEALVASMQGNIGILENGSSYTKSPAMDDAGPGTEFAEKTPTNEKEENKLDKTDDSFVKLYESIDEYLKKNEVQAEVELSKTQTEILIRFKEYILFDSGKAVIKSEAEKVLDGVSEVLLQYISDIQRIRVEGHTDNKPINTLLFPSNWELSGERASIVVRYFQETHEIPGGKLSFAGYGEYHPIDSNETEDGRARNRRVDILIIKTVNDSNQIDTDKEPLP